MMEPAKKIVCIKDDREIATLIGKTLADRGYETFVAYGGHEGIVAILKHRPDGVLCDVNMPGMTGLEVLEQLNELAPQFNRTPFVFLIEPTDPTNGALRRRLCSDDYVVKPIDFDILDTVIRSRFDNSAREEFRPTVMDLDALNNLIKMRFGAPARNELLQRLTLLNNREIETLTWVARGKTSAQIAKVLGVSKRTVDFHLDNARTKLGAVTRTHAAIKAAYGRLIEP
jgi:DNA-binding NarL/FixJ family response regulator